MTTAGTEDIEGFYAAYFTGATGTSLGMFVFHGSKIAGADVGGGMYDGEYKVVGDGKYIEGNVHFLLALGHVSITGASASDQPLSVRVPLKLPAKIDPSEVYRIETPLGPINAKFEKVRSL